MRRIGTDGTKTLKVIIALLFIALLVLLDQISKIVFKTLDENGALYKFTVIENFFFFTYTENTGAAWSFLAGKSWAQTFFKILTSVALVIFLIGFIYACKKNYRFLRVGAVLIIAGTIGNFIDRLLFSAVSDFLTMEISGRAIFGVFNFADVLLCIGIFMAAVHFLFLDKYAVFKKNETKNISDKNGN